MTPQTNIDIFTGAAKDYHMMADVLIYLGDHWQSQPDYKKLAQLAGLSPHHFHKVFTRWTGISPKRFIGAMAHDTAQIVLDEGGTVEDATYEAGLSSPSRLHDLFIKHQALSPGEAKSKAQGVDMVWGVAQSPFGTVVALISPRGLCAYGFCDFGDELATFNDFVARYPKANYTRNDTQIMDITQCIFGGGIVPIALYGTEFQLQVWKALLSVSAGETARYMDIANAINNSKAVRAVGAAIGANPISWVIPCHRILGADKRLTGYHWGVERKRAMLTFESAHKEFAA
ncbi:MAG: 6-O-methylguanine DNA methyltransferase [Robiginitomaculum sp.]|nr:MAG: 6-O-methylguanine DNA methyltransferase [Robiginitomaculum sp.]